MKFCRTSLAVAVSLALTACGGGGGGGGGGPSATLGAFVRSSVPYHTPVNGGSFQPLSGAGTRSVIQDVFTQDLNRDSVDEVVVAGRMSQPATVPEWRDYNLQIYGWNSGSFSRETTSWFANNDNEIRGTEPAVRFADFDGDGNVDMFVPNSTDMNHFGPAVVYFNTGTSSFVRSDVALGNLWSHDGAVADLNGDGKADIVATDYNGNLAIGLAGAGRTFTVHSAVNTSSSSVSVADYLGDGTKTLVLTDAAATGNQDTKLYSWAVVGGNLVLTELAALPASRFYLAKWNTERTAAGVDPHEIRNITMDFNRDGRPDVVVVSTLPALPGTSHGYSEVQFLRNDGAGNFTDVTDSVLSGYNTSTFASYQPVLRDVNNDGLEDIILSAGDTAGDYDSSRVLVATSDGKFVESYGSVFRDFAAQTLSMTSNLWGNTGQTVNIAAGPNGDYYLVTAVNWDDNGTLKTSVYASRITSAGAASAQATLAAISTTWPYLTGVQANEVLAQTASLMFDGVPVIDWQAALSPIGGLGISLDGRTGARMPISGSISVPGMDAAVLNNVSAVDAKGRHFQVDMRTMSTPVGYMPASYSMLGDDTTQNWSSRFVQEPTRDTEWLSVNGQDSGNFSTSLTSRMFGRNDPWLVRVGVTRMPGSPWFQFSGIFGNLRSSTILDGTVTRTWRDGAFVQGGVMQTTTDFDSGLVRSITPIWSGYGVAGWRGQQISLYGGIQPTIFHGQMDLKLPTSVDAEGTMRYTNNKIDIRNPRVGFLGADYRVEHKQHTMKWSAVVNDQAQYQMRYSYSYKF